MPGYQYELKANFTQLSILLICMTVVVNLPMDVVMKVSRIPDKEDLRHCYIIIAIHFIERSILPVLQIWSSLVLKL